MTDRPYTKVAADCWRLICALGEVPETDPDFHAAARNLIEEACTAAAIAAVIVADPATTERVLRQAAQP
jgi:hypothetical protein